MPTNELSLTEAVRNFSDYIGRVAYRHESFVLCKGRRAVAELRPVPTGRRLGDLPGVLRALPHLANEDAVAYGKDVEAARIALDASGAREPWES